MSGQMSEVYCRTCDDNDEDIKNAIDHINSPACLSNITVKRKQLNTDKYKQKQNNILNVESELEFLNKKLKLQTCLNVSKVGGLKNGKQQKLCDSSRLEKSKTNNINRDTNCNDNLNNNSSHNSNTIDVDYEIADDATIFNNDLEDGFSRMNIMTNVDNTIIIHGKEELPVKEQTKIVQINDHLTFVNSRNASKSNNYSYSSNANLLKSHDHKVGEFNTLPILAKKKPSIKVNCTNNHPLLESESNSLTDNDVNDSFNENNYGSKDTSGKNKSNKSPLASIKLKHLYATLPRTKRSIVDQMSVCHKRTMKQLPTRITPDGTTIFYWCDLSKQALKG